MRLDALTGLRWWAAFAVFVYHMRNLAPIPGTDAVSLFGSYGVMFFFVLSGFVLTWSASRTVPISTFYLRRFARIWPAAFASLLLAIPVFYSFHPDAAQWWVKPVDIGVLLLSIPLLQGWSRDPVILYSGNPATWTLAIEFFFYALHPFINRVFRRLSLRGVSIGAASVVIVSFAYKWLVILVPDLLLTQLPLPIMRLNEFILGMLLAHAVRLGWRTRIPMSLAMAVLAALVLLGQAGAKGTNNLGLYALVRDTTNEWMLVIFTLIIACAASRELRGRRSAFSLKPVVKLGEWSFAFYLVHATLIYAVRSVYGVHAGWNNLLWYGPLLLACVGLSGAMHAWVEKPCERRIRSEWDARCARGSSNGSAPPPVHTTPS